MANEIQSSALRTSRVVDDSSAGDEMSCSTPATSNAPLDEQRAAEARMQSLVDEGPQTDARAASRRGDAPNQSDAKTPSLEQRRLEAWIEDRKHLAERDKPLEHDPIGQALVNLPFALAQGAVQGVGRYLLSKLATDLAKNQVKEFVHDMQNPTRPEKSPAQKPAPSSCDVPDFLRPSPCAPVGIRG